MKVYSINQKDSLNSKGLLLQVAKNAARKKRCCIPKKAQLVFEFIVAALIFFMIVFYAINYLNWIVSGYSSEFSAENMESEASQIGELLVLNKGNWSGGYPVALGLAQEWPVLNSSKISWLNTSCNALPNGYANITGSLDLNPRYRMKIIIKNETSFLVDCGLGIPILGNVTKAETRRYALSESGSLLSLYVTVWTTGK